MHCARDLTHASSLLDVINKGSRQEAEAKPGRALYPHWMNGLT